MTSLHLVALFVMLLSSSGLVSASPIVLPERALVLTRAESQRLDAAILAPSENEPRTDIHRLDAAVFAPEPSEKEKRSTAHRLDAAILRAPSD
ncbi:hypothetical protein K474DRAFT_1661931 [Panus rudis PR-1116 ss-1]|nr:hypothetical protein K474DRAFT_1661931 [Panus rudis PR-1116 ss-1]